MTRSTLLAEQSGVGQTGARHTASTDQGRLDAHGHAAQSGYGACSKCNCQEYEGNDWQCANCGHHFRDHW